MFFPWPISLFFPPVLVWSFEEPVGVRVGVFLFSLSVTLATVFSSSCSNVLWANRVQSCLSVSPRLGFLSLFCSAFLSCWRLFSILVISSSFVLLGMRGRSPPPPASLMWCPFALVLGLGWDVCGFNRLTHSLAAAA